MVARNICETKSSSSLSLPPDTPCRRVAADDRSPPASADVTGVGDRDDALLVLDQVLHVEVAGGSGDLRTATVTESGDQTLEVVLDDAVLALLTGEDVAVVGDASDQLVVFGLQLVALQTAQAT